MDRFLDYISRFVPDFRARIRGASADEIGSLERAARRPLPKYYRQFLARMGHDTGGVSLGYETTTDITEVIDFHAMKRRPTPPDCIAIAVFGVDFDVCLYVPPAGGERVLATDGFHVYVVVAETLEKALFQYAFRNHEIPSFPHVAAGSIDNMAARAYAAANGRSMRDAARDLAGQLGFAPEGFSDTYSFCGRKDGAAVFILQQEEQGGTAADMGTVVAVGAPAKEEAERLAAPFRELLGLRPYTYRPIV